MGSHSEDFNDDSHMDELNPNTNYGTSPSLTCQYSESPQQKAQYINAIARVDFSEIEAAGVTSSDEIDSATVRLYVHTVLTTIGAKWFPVTDARYNQWTEAGVTWNKYDGTNNWTSNGGDMDGSPLSDEVFPNNIGWWEWDCLTQIQDAFDTRNCIWSAILKATSYQAGSTSFFNFYSIEEEALVPELVIAYTLAGAAPKTRCLLIG